MRVFAINSSPRSGGQSKTELMLNHLVDGMRAAGAAVDVVNLREKRIKNCIGCFTCWTKTPGHCIHKDDMARELFPQWLAADLAVYATPLYYHTMNAAMSAFRERTLPAVQPFLAPDADGKTMHPLRNSVPAAVWLAVCGFPEASEFYALSDYLHRTCHPDVRIVAEIYRAAAETMTSPFFEAQAQDILSATRQAGRELVASMAVSPETLARITQPFVETGAFIQMGNLFWKTCIAEGVAPKTFHEKNMVPRPESLADFMLLFPAGLNAAAAGDRKVILQFQFSGQVEGGCYFTIEGGQITAFQGTCETPDLTVDTPFEVWMDIMTRKADGQQMFMEGQYRVHGDLALMVALFKRGEDH